jgi:hypothetical protein
MKKIILVTILIVMNALTIYWVNSVFENRTHNSSPCETSLHGSVSSFFTTVSVLPMMTLSTDNVLIVYW